MEKSLSDIVKKGFDDIGRANYGVVFNESLADTLKKHVAEMRLEYPDISYQLKSAVERGNTVAFQWTGTGTEASTGRRLAWNGTGVARVLNGKIHNIRVSQNALERDIQRAVVPRTGFGALSGRWRGRVFGLVVDMTLGHDDAGLWGRLNVENVGESELEGTSSETEVNFTTVLSSGDSVHFVGRLRGGDILEGTVTGVEGPVSFIRQ